MTPQEAVEFYGSQAKVAREMGVSDAAVYLWIKNGGIPYDKQCQLQVATAGQLVARREDEPRARERAA